MVMRRIMISSNITIAAADTTKSIPLSLGLALTLPGVVDTLMELDINSVSPISVLVNLLSFTNEEVILSDDFMLATIITELVMITSDGDIEKCVVNSFVGV